jgi:hypothetical protein
MRTFLKVMQALGIAVTGTGLMLGIAHDSMGEEYLYALIGIVIFSVARFVETRLEL